HLAGYNRVRYVDVAEELVSVLCLMEEATSKQDREYFYIDDSGIKECVIKVTEDEVLIKQLYLNKYLILKEMHLCTYFYFDAEIGFGNPAIADISPTQGGDAGIDNKTPTYIHNNLIRPEFVNRLYQSWQQGKSVLKYTELSEIDEQSYIEFIIGLDKRTGEPIKRSCRCDESEYYEMVYFDKSVMDKYYTNGDCKVSATKLSTEFFSMRIDCDNWDFIGVYLKDLCNLPIKELKHWQAHNIAPNEKTKQSRSFDLTMNEGCWNAPIEQEDLLFRDRLSEFNRKWLSKFGWCLFKPLHSSQESNMSCLCIPHDCSKVQFNMQIESLALILVDSINVDKLKEGNDINEDGGINILNCYLVKSHIPADRIIDFLRCLQTLRSKATSTHRYSETKQLSKSLAYFSITPDFSNMRDGIRQVFALAIIMLDNLESNLI
ncbi:MAG: hypothetical protein SNI70_11755, partial [Rikenellaceae bacterium]